MAAAGSSRLLPLLRAAHFGPTIAVTIVTALLAVATDLEPAYAAVVVAAVLAGQLTIGWSNDLVDAVRDRAVGRTDKPLANDELPRGLVVGWLAGAAAVCLVLSLLAGWRSGAVHLLAVVASGHAYNLGMKATAWSWVPYAVAFGTLPAVVTLAGGTPSWPPAWMLATAAALGVAAHLLNALPDLLDDERTGVRGLPHVLGATRSRWCATVLLVTGSAVAAFGPSGAPGLGALGALVVVVGLGALALFGRGKAPFHAAVAIALVDVALLTVVGA